MERSVHEEWRVPVASDPFYQQAFDKYEVSSLGGIRNRKTGRHLKGWERYGKPYRVVRFWFDHDIYCTPYIHHLVAYTFLGPPPADGFHVHHQDGDPSNNAATNLRWVEAFLNNADPLHQEKARRARHGTA